MRPNILLWAQLPPQIRSEQDAEIYSSLGEGFAITMGTTGIIQILLNQFSSFFLQSLWSMLNGQQLILYLSLFSKVLFPANLSMVNRQLHAIVSFDLLSSEFLESQIVAEQDEDVDGPLNMNFDVAGYDSVLFIMNAFTIISYLTIFLPITALLNLCSCGRKYLRKNQVFWNGYIRLLMESYFEIMLTTLLNLNQARWSSEIMILQISNYFAAVCASVFVLASTVMLSVAWKKRANWNEKRYIERFGSLLQGTSLNSNHFRSSIMLMAVQFFAIRFLLVILILQSADKLWLQIQLMIVSVLVYGAFSLLK